MIIQNGTIEIKNKAASGIDQTTGYPVKPSSASWGVPIPCQYITNKYSNLGIVDGEHFKTASYQVLIEEQDITGEQLRLKDRNGETVGEFSIIQVEPLQAVCEVRILI